MKFWWVNHKQTHRQEISGGYLWSPREESGRKFSQFYQNMRLVRAGDPIVSYAGGAVRALGTAREGALLSPRPEEFGAVGAQWASSGWLVTVDWTLIEPFYPRSRHTEITALLPDKYSPLQVSSLSGNQKAYLCEISAELFHVVRLASAALPEKPEVEISGEKALDFRMKLEEAEEERVRQDKALSETEREQICKARRGQGLFRSHVFEIETACRLTGITNQRLLIASHIKPWRSCETARERLDGHNGLLLTPHSDYLFDLGLISFDSSGDLLRSQNLHLRDLARLGLPRTLNTRFTREQKQYLEFLQDVVFQS